MPDESGKTSPPGARRDAGSLLVTALMLLVIVLNLVNVWLGLVAGGTRFTPSWLAPWLAATSALSIAALILVRYRSSTRGIREKNEELQQANSKLADINVLLKEHIVWRKRTEKERQRIIEELEAKSAEMERFTYAVSHDLKSPLITIRGFLGLVEQDVADGNLDRMSQDMNRIKKAVAKMSQLLDELLELSRIGRLVNPPEDVSMVELAREAAELAAGRIAERNAQLAIDPSLPPAYGDRPRLLEVFQNLIDNGVKFMGDQPEPAIEVGYRPEPDGAVYYVKDNGVGIDPRYHEKVFGLFDRLDQEVDGTGIGLALVKRIVEVHGGRIWVESEGAGTGSTFCFTVPRHEDAGETSGPGDAADLERPQALAG